MIAASGLTVRYTLGDLEVDDSHNVHGIIDARGVFVLVADPINYDEIAAAIQRDLGNVPAVAEVFTVLFIRRQREREAYARKRHYEVPDEDWQRILDSYQPPELDPFEPAAVIDPPTAPAIEGVAPADPPAPTSAPGSQGASDPDHLGARSDVQEAGTAQTPPAPIPAARGVPFRGRTQLPSPKGSNQRLRERLGASFPGRRTEIDEYFQDAAAPMVATIGAHPDEDGVVRRARTILRAANLEEGFLQFDASAMAIFRAAGTPDEILLMADDDEDPLLAKIDYDRAILHAGDSNDEKVRFRAFLERDALPPGAILELQATHQTDEYHLHANRLDEPQTFTDVSWWDFDDDGAPTTMSASVCLPFLVHEATYRAERRWEQRDAYAALIGGNPGVLTDVHSFLEGRAKSGVGGAMPTEIHRHLLSHDHPCGYYSVLGVLYGYACFAPDEDGRWCLVPVADQTRRAGYEKNLAAERTPTAPRREGEEGEVSQPAPGQKKDSGVTRYKSSTPSSPATGESDSRSEVQGALSPTQLTAVESALAALGLPDRGNWLDAARSLTELFAQLARAIETRQHSAENAQPETKREPPTELQRVPELLQLARKHEKDPQVGLAAALLAWQVSYRLADRRQGQSLRVLGLAMQQAAAPRWALRCLEEAARRHKEIVPKLAPLREAARRTSGDEKATLLHEAQAGARALAKLTDLSLPELEEGGWPAQALVELNTLLGQQLSAQG